jgi:prepilin-type N-terminal cleavage/methylation domain-containing protein
VVNAVRTKRRGFTFVEVIVAAAMLAVLLSLAGQMLVQARRHSRIAEQRGLALRTVENALEELTAKPWDEINDAALAQLAVPASLARRWPQAAFTGAVAESDQPVASKRLTLQLQLAPSQPALSAKLTTWIYRTPAN